MTTRTWCASVRRRRRNSSAHRIPGHPVVRVGADHSRVAARRREHAVRRQRESVPQGLRHRCRHRARVDPDRPRSAGSKGLPECHSPGRREHRRSHGLRGLDACPAGPEKANDVVTTINAAIDSFPATHRRSRTSCWWRCAALCAFARVDDFTSVANESGYDTDRGTAILGYGARAGKMLSDDPYADLAPVPVPRKATARAEPRRRPPRRDTVQISAQVHAFASSTNGRLNPQTALTTGYDFLKDGATSVSGFLGQYVTGRGSEPIGDQ